MGEPKHASNERNFLITFRLLPLLHLFFGNAVIMVDYCITPVSRFSRTVSVKVERGLHTITYSYGGCKFCCDVYIDRYVAINVGLYKFYGKGYESVVTATYNSARNRTQEALDKLLLLGILGVICVIVLGLIVKKLKGIG